MLRPLALLIPLVFVGCDDDDDAATPDDLGAPDLAVTTDGGADLPDGPLPDAAPPPAGEVSLNEVDCRGRDWVEVVNLGRGRADLTGWTISDAAVGPGHTLTSTLPANRFLRVRQQTRDDDGFEFGIACGADTVYLRDAAGEVVDSVEVPLLLPDLTWGRLPDGTGAWAETEPTPGAANRAHVDPSVALYDPANLVQIDLVAEPEAIEQLREAPREYVPVQVRVADDAGLTGPISAGLRIKGRAGSFRSLDQKPAFKLKFDFVQDGQRFRGLKRLTLNNLVQDPSMLHEWVAYTIFRALDVPAPRIGYVYLTLNGQPYGLYANIETPDDVFLDRWFPSTHHLYEGAYGQDLFEGHVGNLEVDEGSEADRDDLEALVEALDDHEEGGFYAASADLVDWPRVLRMMAAEVYTGHWDGYAPSRNNYYFHFDADGRLTVLPWGTDQTFEARLGLHDGRGRLMEVCMADRDCRSAYDEALGEVADTVAMLDLPPLIRGLARHLRPWAEQDPRRAYDMRQVDNHVDRTIEFLIDRAGDVAELLACLRGPAADADGDGFLCDADCDNGDPNTYPGAPEVCGDRRDQDCNGYVDDGFDCPDCREHFRGPHRYLVCPTPRSYDEMRLHCNEEGAEPAKVDSEAEAVWLHRTAVELARQDYWLGASDAEDEGRWRWWDGTPLEFTRWDEGEPNNAGEQDCLHIRANGGRWNDRNCEARQGVLCEDECAPGEDADGDGFERCGLDCDDGDPAVGPGAEEVCDGVDNDCNGRVDDLPDCICIEVMRDERRYLVCPEPRPWAEAREICQSVDADLAVLDDEAEAEWLFEQAIRIQRQDYYFGLTDRAEEGTFVWVDGTPLSYENWHEGEPNDAGGNEDCAHFWGAGGLWNDIPCGFELGFLCEEV